MSDFATDPTNDSALIMEVLFEMRTNVRTILALLLEEDDGQEEEDDAPNA